MASQANKLNDIPDDVQHIIYDYLDFPTICNLNLVSKRSSFFLLSNHNRYWQEVFDRCKPKTMGNQQQINYREYIVGLKHKLDTLMSSEKRNSHSKILQFFQENFAGRRSSSNYPDIYIGKSVCDHLFKRVHNDGCLLSMFRVGLELHRMKIVLVGSGHIGKTSFMLVALGCDFPHEYVPTICDDTYRLVTAFNINFVASYCDTAGFPGYERLRPLAYPETELFIVMYSVVDPASYRDVSTMWIPEIDLHQPQTPILLIGTKIDLRENADVISDLAKNNEKPLTYEDGVKLAKRLGCLMYIEVSALTQEGMDQVHKAEVQAFALYLAMNSTPSTRSCLIA